MHFFIDYVSKFFIFSQPAQKKESIYIYYSFWISVILNLKFTRKFPSYLKTTYWEPYGISKMKLFVKTVNRWKPLINSPKNLHLRHILIHKYADLWPVFPISTKNIPWSADLKMYRPYSFSLSQIWKCKLS